MDLIDTHCHLTFADLAGDIEAVLAIIKPAYARQDLLQASVNLIVGGEQFNTTHFPITIPELACNFNLFLEHLRLRTIPPSPTIA